MSVVHVSGDEGLRGGRDSIRRSVCGPFGNHLVGREGRGESGKRRGERMWEVGSGEWR